MAWVIIMCCCRGLLSVVLEGEGRQYFMVVAFSLHAKIYGKAQLIPPPPPQKKKKNTHTQTKKLAESLCTSIPLFYAKDQSRVAQQAKMTVDEHPLVTNMRTQIQPKHSHTYDPTKLEWAGYAVQVNCGNPSGKQAHRHFEGSSQLCTCCASVHGSCHISPWLIEFSGNASSCFTAATFHLGWFSDDSPSGFTAAMFDLGWSSVAVMHQVVSHFLASLFFQKCHS